MKHSERQVYAALSTLVMLQMIMLGSLFAGIKPHPPALTPLFAIAPFLAVSVSTAISAMIVQPLNNRTGQILSTLACLMALISFGPQKYFDAQFGLIWPAVMLGQGAALIVFLHLLRAHRSKSQNTRTVSN
ncbi:MAG: hypothetical protein AAGA53_05670 [Pseudomonadota bacterium]